MEAEFGKQSFTFLYFAWKFGAMYNEQGEYIDAAKWLQQALLGAEVGSDPHNRLIGYMLANLAYALYMSGSFVEAEHIYHNWRWLPKDSL